ncbi:MAG TPA: hypothetical protein VF245_02910, partial [Solirubrobacterales bacterium]
MGLLVLLALPALAKADFGFVPGSVEARALKRDGTTETRAGSHPYSFSVHFELKTDEKGEPEGGEVRNILVDLPPGFFGNPQAVPSCPQRLFGSSKPKCSPGTQVGFVRAVVPGIGEASGALYNLTPPPGSPAMLGFSAGGGLISLQFPAVRTEEGYGLTVSAPNLPVPVASVTETIWGVPADEGHTPQRGSTQAGGVKSEAPLLPFITLPASCEAPPAILAKAASRQAPDVFAKEGGHFLNAAGQPTPMSACGEVPFSPKIASQPTSKLASNPSGLDFETKLPNQGLLAPGNIAETEPRKAVIALPEGMSVNPSFAEGIAVCSQEQYEAEKLETEPGQGCPQASKIGSMIAHSPLLEEPVEGALYLAAPYENEFGTLGAIYLVARAPERGVLIKQAGRVDFDPATGQITSTFEGLPPLPYSSFKVHLREGARAPLVTPSACGQYETTAKLTPFSVKDDSEASVATASFQIERGPDGGACPKGGLPPFKPVLLAGTTNNAAGRFSPFNLRISRTDAE